jgi:hypothetical protein
MSADRVFELGIVLAAVTGIDRAAPGGALQDPRWTLAARTVSVREPHR